MSNHVLTAGATAFGNLTQLTVGNCCVNFVNLIMGAVGPGTVQLFDAAATTEVTLGTTIATYVLTAGTSSAVEGVTGSELQFLRGIAAAVTTTPIGSSTLSASVRVWVS